MERNLDRWIMGVSAAFGSMHLLANPSSRGSAVARTKHCRNRQDRRRRGSNPPESGRFVASGSRTNGEGKERVEPLLFVDE
jgi:hypothetical protein